MRGSSRFLLALLLLALTFGGVGSARAQDEKPVCDQTGNFCVTGLFLAFYNQSDDPLLFYGYPITNEMADPLTGRTVQYFNRARFERVETASGPQVQLAPLGELVYAPDPAATSVPLQPSACRLVPATGYSICYGFLEYYDAHNGPVNFGSPLSEIFVEDGRLVQYFERTRLEWRPDDPSGDKIAISDLGKIYYDRRVGTPPQIQTDFIPANKDDVRQLRLYAFVGQSLLPANSDQSLYIIVLDQKRKPVEGATVFARATLPNGDVVDLSSEMTLTDGSGISRVKFHVGQFNPRDLVQVEVRTVFNSLESQSSTWFRIWW